MKIDGNKKASGCVNTIYMCDVTIEAESATRKHGVPNHQKPDRPGLSRCLPKPFYKGVLLREPVQIFLTTIKIGESHCRSLVKMI